MPVRSACERRLTITLSGLARRVFRAAEHAIHCEDGAATMTAGPLERIVRLHLTHRSLLSRSAMRVCHPGPVAFQRSMTSTGRRIEMSFRGFAERGRPPLFTTARESAFSVGSGSSLYSRARMECASTLARSDFKVRRETGFFTIVCLSHAEYVARCTPRGVADYNEAPGQHPVANDAAFAVVLPRIFDLNRDALEDDSCVFKVQPAIGQRARTFDWVNVIRIGYCSYNNPTSQDNGGTAHPLCNLTNERDFPCPRGHAVPRLSCDT